MSTEGKQIAVVGGGYVGLTSAACFSELGHTVRVLDIDPSKVEALLEGKSPIYEEGLEDLLQTHVGSGRLTASTSVEEVVPGADFVFLCVPTPSASDGSADLTYLEQAARDIAEHLEPGSVVINKSTVPVGSTDVVRKQLLRDDVMVASNPEFLREGTAIYDFMNPDRVVIGCVDSDVAQTVADLYSGVAETEIVLTDPASAELIKYASNAYLATRLTFINAVAEVCEVLGGDITQVSRAIGLDSRIGPNFLRPGPGWGGSCFPKDTRALASMAERGGYEFRFLRAVLDSNQEQFDLIARRATELLGHEVEGATAAVLGLAFKAGTDDVRDSPAIEVINRLVAAGVKIKAHDPQAKPVVDGVTQVDSPYEAADGAHLLIVLTEWPEYGSLDPERLAEAMAHSAVLDTRNMVDPAAFTAAGFAVRQIGRPIQLDLRDLEGTTEG